MLSSSRRLLFKGSRGGSSHRYLGYSSSSFSTTAVAGVTSSSSVVVWGEIKVALNIGGCSGGGGGNNHRRSHYLYQSYQTNQSQSHPQYHQYLSKMSFHFGSTEYASCFEDIPGVNTNDIKKSSLDYLKTFDIQQWYDDPVSLRFSPLCFLRFVFVRAFFDIPLFFV